MCAHHMCESFSVSASKLCVWFACDGIPTFLYCYPRVYEKSYKLSLCLVLQTRRSRRSNIWTFAEMCLIRFRCTCASLRATSHCTTTWSVRPARMRMSFLIAVTSYLLLMCVHILSTSCFIVLHHSMTGLTDQNSCRMKVILSE